MVMIETFKSSTLAKPAEMTEYLQSLLSDQYNKFCIDCKVKESTHCLVMYGTFVCESCAEVQKLQFGFMHTYPKRIFEDQWDDWQLSSIDPKLGGNKQLYDLFVEYEI
jgi:hypothetical protein